MQTVSTRQERSVPSRFFSGFLFGEENGQQLLVGNMKPIWAHYRGCNDHLVTGMIDKPHIVGVQMYSDQCGGGRCPVDVSHCSLFHLQVY